MNKRQVTYVLMLSSYFPKGHPREGQPTGFREAFLQGQSCPEGEGAKLHTVRGNADLWEKRARKINDGDAVLSVRQWSGKPYGKGSRQTEIGRLTRLGIQQVLMGFAEGKPFACVRREDLQGTMVPVGTLASNDGLTEEDFTSWFRLSDRRSFRGGILHFTGFRY